MINFASLAKRQCREEARFYYLLRTCRHLCRVIRPQPLPGSPGIGLFVVVVFFLKPYRGRTGQEDTDPILLPESGRKE
jgi:hypothetical protein